VYEWIGRAGVKERMRRSAECFVFRGAPGTLVKFVCMVKFQLKVAELNGA